MYERYSFLIRDEHSSSSLAAAYRLDDPQVVHPPPQPLKRPRQGDVAPGEAAAVEAAAAAALEKKSLSMFFFRAPEVRLRFQMKTARVPQKKGFVFSLSHRAPGFAGPDHVAVAAVASAAAAVASVSVTVAAAATVVELLAATISDDAPSPLTFVTHFPAFLESSHSH